MTTIIIHWFAFMVSLLHFSVGTQGNVALNSENYLENFYSQLHWRIPLQPENDDLLYDDQSCPSAEELYPCQCKLSTDGTLVMNCSLVESEEDLENIFQSDFPSLDFQTLMITENYYLEVLREDVFGNVTFKNIYIADGVLKVIEPNALSSSYDTAKDIVIMRNHIVSFPFEELPQFSKLQYLSLSSNRLTAFPTLASSSLLWLDLSTNFFYNNIQSEALHQLRKLEYINFFFTFLTEIYEGTFTRLPHLRTVFLGGNLLQHIADGAIDLNGIPGASVFLFYNRLQSLAPNALTGVDYLIHASHNNITVLEEEVWRPHMEQGVRLYLAGNPLECGCDIAWLIVNEAFMDLIEDDVTCEDGLHLADLDPSNFADYC